MTRTMHFSRICERICGQDARYHADAYEFLLNGLQFTRQQLNRDGHISGQELIQGLITFARQEYGKMAMTVWKHWGIFRGEDWGNVVFNLIQEGVLGKSSHDRKEDFKQTPPLEHAFDDCFEI